MKNALLLFCLLCLTTQLWAQTPSVNSEEEEAIKKVIISGTEAWIEGNLEAYTSLFVNKPYFLWAVTNGNESLFDFKDATPPIRSKY